VVGGGDTGTAVWGRPGHETSVSREDDYTVKAIKKGLVEKVKGREVRVQTETDLKTKVRPATSLKTA